MTQKNKQIDFPIYDDQGINLADPHDKLGRKTEYISILQKKAIERYVGKSTGHALDVGCGYGRMAKVLGELGYKVTGVEPSDRVLSAAKLYQPEHTWKVGELPILPVEKNSFDLVCLFSVARVLHLMERKPVCETLPNYVKPGKKMVIIDNIRKNDKRYIPEEWFENFFLADNFSLVKKIPIRSSRWPVIYMIRYGLIPEKWFDIIAEWELNRMAKKKKAPKWSYHNYIFIYEKK